MSREIKFKDVRAYQDNTCEFVVEGVEGMKVRDFISCIISKRHEDSGVFTIDGTDFPYDNKKRRLSINTDWPIGDLTIDTVKAHGAYWLINYKITTKKITQPIMSKETIFKEGAWVGGYEYTDERTLKEDIARKENDVLWYKEKLLALAMATPRDITPDGADPMEHVKLTFDELWDELQDELFRLSDMYLIEANKDCIDKQ